MAAAVLKHEPRGEAESENKPNISKAAVVINHMGFLQISTQNEVGRIFFTILYYTVIQEEIKCNLEQESILLNIMFHAPMGKFQL